ncbi:hypothetical protein N431DRAFT_139478 [Stipitochalara longipes BDJ]|nr:hypothetical protein N431DRAFT_139478 [Stipitochalara longipes BDJ]
MWLGIKEWIDGKELDALILHEIYHMLGFGHEHSSPNCPIKWSRDVFAYFWTKCRWDPVTTYRNVLMRHQAHEVWASPYDPKSIMHYEVPPFLTQDMSCVLRNYELSVMDKKSLEWMYPKPQADLATNSRTTFSLAAVLQFPRVNTQRGLGISSLGSAYLAWSV